MKTIKAKVNSRLLAKADRLFTGTLGGRVIEIIQNARRADATQVKITNVGGWVTVRDNGNGVDDFAKLLDLGGSGWDERTEQSEDPAGVGLFCLAPREVTIRSRGKTVRLDADGWRGKQVVVEDDGAVSNGTELRFRDEPWDLTAVEPSVVFSGLNVVVDGQGQIDLGLVLFLPAQRSLDHQVLMAVDIAENGYTLGHIPSR